MRFLVDQNLPVALCDWLSAKNHQAEHIRLLGLRDASDADIVRHAKEAGAIVIIRDVDFTPKAGGDNLAKWFQMVWVRIGNTANDDLFAEFEAQWPAIVAALERGDPIVEVA